MTRVSEYVRPRTIGEALRLLGRDGSAMVIGGGTRLCMLAEPRTTRVVDLQALPLASIDVLGGTARIGATTTLQQIVDDVRLPPTIRDAARRERPATLRSIGTLGGCVATGHWESELLASLLVHDARVETIAPGREARLALEHVLREGPGGSIITGVVVATDGRSAAVRTGRTRADLPIVAAVARRSGAGRMHLALTGVATFPLLVDGIDGVAGLVPPSDFRGSSEYRRHLALTLAARVLEEVG